VSVFKKNSKLKVYIDFINLNITTLKDEYLIVMDVMLINATFGNEKLSFMDGHSCYN